MLTRRVWETNHHTYLTIRMNARRKNVLPRVNNRLHTILLSIIRETAIYLSLPQIQCLVNVLYQRHIIQVQPNGSQMKTMRVGAKVFFGIFLPASFLELCRIQLLVPTSKVTFHQHIFYTICLSLIFHIKTMPSPITHGSQWHTVTVFLRKRLQTSSIHRASKMPVAHRQRGQFIH